MLDEDYFNIRDRLIEEGYVEANPKRWVRPDKGEVNAYFMSKIEHGAMALSSAEEFMSYWDGLDWMVRKTRIKSWKGRANTWIKNNEKYKKSNGGGLAGYDNESTNWG